jgi:hypothetical protein
VWLRLLLLLTLLLAAVPQLALSSPIYQPVVSTVNPGIFFARRFRLSAMEGFRLAMDIVVRVDDVLHCGTFTNAMTCTRMVAVAINR